MNTALSPLLSDSFSLKDRVVVVTCGAGQLGQEAARAALEAGAEVVIGDSNYARAQRVASDLGGREVSAGYLNPTRRDSCHELLAAIIAKHGRIDVVLNGPDEALSTTPVHQEQPLEKWHAELAMGMRGALGASLAFGAFMAASGGGTIVNIVPGTDLVPGLDAESVIVMTRYLANYFQDDGVRVNSIFEGTPPRALGARFAEPLQGISFLSRIVKCEETRAAIVFLASEASRQLHGKTVIAARAAEDRTSDLFGFSEGTVAQGAIAANTGRVA
jgi:NAD(P)-dependent dehydrogenase (short-subunit alcohol dehydrogenase family)